MSKHSTYETSQPWVVYDYLRTDEECDAHGGESIVKMTCAICGETEDAVLRLPPVGEPVPDPVGGKHPIRVAFLAKHIHKLQQTAPETWALPLLNPAAHRDTLDILRDVAEKARHQTSPVAIPAAVLSSTCRQGEGAATCAFLVSGNAGWVCAKGSNVEPLIQEKRATMRAKGDNCDGPPTFTAGAR